MKPKTLPVTSGAPTGTGAQPVASVQWIARDRLRANHYNPNRVAPPELELLALSILEDGWTQPIVARASMEIVDGFHRWTVSDWPQVRALTDGHVPVVFLPDTKAVTDQMMATIRHNRARGEHGVRPMAAIVRDLITRGLPVEELCERLGMETEEVERLYDQAGMPQKVARETTMFNTGWMPQED